MAARHFAIGQPVHEAEAHGIRILVSALPDSYVVYTNVELPTGRAGQTLEHDAVVLAPHGVYTVELKSWGGRIQGNRDRWTLADGTLAQSPIPLVNHKAKLLKSLLKSKRADLDRDLHVQGLIFLSAGNATPTITPDYADFVITRPDLQAALTDRTRYDFRGSLSDSQRKVIEAVLADDRAPRRQSDRLGDYQLVQRLLTDDRPYEAWLGRTNLTQEVRVLHAYAISGQTEREQGRARARALREATLHSRLIGGRDLLRYHDYFVTADDPQRIVLTFEDTTPLRVLESWAKDLNPGLTARLKVMARVARALDVLHNRELVHRRLSLEAILVSRQEDPHDVRLCAVDLARDLTGRVPTITSDSIDPTASRFSAPDLVRTGEASPQSDIFSLGAVCFELFTGRPLFQSVDELLRPFEVPPMYIGDRPVPQPIAALVRRMLDPRPERRPTSAEDVAVEIENYLADQHRAERRRDLAPGEVLRDTYELKQRLGHGATATTWLVEHLQTRHRLVLKLGEARHAARLRHESLVLARAAHPNLVRYFNIEPHDGGCMLVLSYAEGVSAADWAGAGDPLTAAQLHRLAKGLLEALQALHDAGFIHRDVKPDNVILAEPGARPTLIDVGIACPIDQEGDLAVGTVHYKDPLVYSESRWTPANDQFAVFLVLYEVLTGAHPFGGPPDADRRPAIVIDDLPDTLDDDQKRDLAALFTRALAPERAARPASLVLALAELRTALHLAVPAPQPAAAQASAAPQPPPPEAPQPPPPPPPRLPADATLDTLISALDLAARTHGALVRFGVTTLRQLGRLDPAACHRRGVGRKTLDDLRSLHDELHARFPGQFEGEFTPEPPLPFFPALVGDPRSLDELAPSLTTGALAALRAMGLRTLGELASTPAAAITAIDHLGPNKLARMRQGLLKLSGQVSGPDTLDALDALLRAELGDRSHAMLAAVFGLHDGNILSQSEAGAQLGVSRQRINQAVDLAALRLGASHGRTLVDLLDSVLPPVGFTTLAHAVEALALRLPAVDPAAVSHLGYTRLAALLFRPDGVTAERRDIDLVFRPPWTSASLAALRGRLAALANWPPHPRARAERDLWDMLDEPGQRALVRFGADAPQLVDAVLRLGADVLADPLGGLYTPPVALHDALALLRPQLSHPRLDAETLVNEAIAAFKGLEVPPDAAARAHAIERAGFRRDGDRWIDPDRVQTPEPPLVPSVDRAIPRQFVRDDSQPPVVEALVAAASRGGFRVVAMAPATHHIQSRQLARWLAQALGEDRVHTITVDRVLLDALKHAGQWDYARHYEARPDADWRWSHAALTSALNEAVAPAKPGQVTVLTQPALLGTLGLMPWLSGFYDRARGGRFGLIVLAIPGGVHDNRVRLNERFNLPYTPDMAGVYLEAL